MSKTILTCCLIAASATCLLWSTAHATEFVLNPIADTWLREAASGSSYDADFISIWSSPVDGGARYGVLSFDTSGISEPITSARLELYMVDYARNTAYDYVQESYLVTPAVTDDSTLTWDSYHGAAGLVETPLEGLGVYNLPATNTLLQFYSSSATAADVALLEAQRAAGTATFIFKAQEPASHEEEVTEMQGRHDWADLYVNSGATPPQILIDGTPIDAGIDHWIRESNGQIYNDDWISVWHEDDGVSGQRFGILEFDLSGVTSPISDVKMNLYSLLSSFNDEAFEQEAFVLDTDLATSSIDWATYHSAAVTEIPLESLGHYLFEQDTDQDLYHESDAASAADLALLEGIIAGDGKLVIALKSIPQEVTHMVTITDDPGSRDWADTESTYTGYGLPPATNPQIWPRLIINEAPLIPGDANDDGVVDAADAADLAANWLVQSDATWAMGDFNGDGKVNDIDATILATNWQTGAAASSSVPEPNCIALILCGLIAICAIRRNK